MTGYFALVLHSHIPYVMSHGQWPHGMDWLMEATCETYLPLLRMLNKLVSDGIRPSITLGFTPILLEQFASDQFREQLYNYLEERITITDDNLQEFEQTGQGNMAGLAKFWRNHYVELREFYRQEIGENLIDNLSELNRDGKIEIITSGATHGYFPLLGQDTSISAQIKAGKSTHKRILGVEPAGFWLPECAYRPRYEWKPSIEDIEYPAKLRKGIEEFLSEEGFHYFFIDSHLLRGGKAIGMYADRFKGLKELWKQFRKGYQWDEVTEFTGNPFQAYLINSSGEDKRPIAIYTRDSDTSLQVWSGEHGYPGDGWYLDFHKKHFPGGLRYWRVTSNQCDLADKELYEVERTKDRYEENATHFVSLIRNRTENLKREDGNPPIVVSPYDTELFGHWWFEGLYWLDSVIRQIDKDPRIHMITCGEHFKAHQPAQVIRVPEGSWGEGGYHFIWLNEKTEWTWRHIYPAEDRMKELAGRNQENGDPFTVEIVKKAATQLLLMQSSDWQFLISTGAASDYAEARFLEHCDSFNMLCDFAEKTASGECLNPTEIAYLEMCSLRDNVFPDLELSWFAEVDFPPKEN